MNDIARHLPALTSLEDTRQHPLTEIVSSDGIVLARFETHYRRPISLDRVSPFLINATLATEDARYYSHGGIDVRGILRAGLSNLRSHNPVGQGGSTITQQLVRNLYLSNKKTVDRKIEEMLLAGRMEQRYSKRQILEAYLNTIYYGSGCYGAEAASRAYFHKPASELTLGEAALLAGVPQRPTAYSPVDHLPEALRRRETVLGRMVSQRLITTSAAAEASALQTRVYRPEPETQKSWRAPYFVAYVLDKLQDHYGPEFLFSGVRVVTTLNWQIQRSAEKALHEGLVRNRAANTGALVALDPRTGAIRALVGGPNFQKSQFDAATQGIRQPGSAFKPIVYAAAFDSNVCSLANTVEDARLTYPNPPHDWTVHNYDGRYRGPVTVLDAIRESINTIAVRVIEKTGPETVARYAEQLGISTPLTANLPLALGASGVRPIELCSAFTAFANGGTRFDPYSVAQIADSRGVALYHDDPDTRRHASFLYSDTIDQVNVALRQVVANGTGSAASGVPDAHGKTGTTSSHRDAWFVGYTGELAAVVWMAHEARSSLPHGRSAVSYLPMPMASGGGFCAPVWARFMRQAAPIQIAVDRRRGTAIATVTQPELETLVTKLREQLDQTGFEQAKAQEAQQALSGDQAEEMPAGPGPAPLTAAPGAAAQSDPENGPDLQEGAAGGPPAAGYRVTDASAGGSRALVRSLWHQEDHFAANSITH